MPSPLCTAGLTILIFCAAARPPQAAVKELSGDRIPAAGGDLIVHPIEHATVAIQWAKTTMYVDPVGGPARFADLPRPDLILITDDHGDHFDPKTLEGILSPGGNTRIVAPKAVAEKLPAELRDDRTTVLSAGEKAEVAGVAIEAVPAYNTTPQRQKFHPKGRGNGYLLQLGGKKVYIAGDTEDTPEMRKLRGVDVAFLPMNLPYTMTVEQAADAVRALKPKIVYPYHFRSAGGKKTDLGQFEKLVGRQSGVEVRIRRWYP
jgi:L-ascorbate metabolism protein UlaG (beta-lactamase superfamily)